MEKVEFNSEIYYFGFVDRNEDRIVLVVGDDVEEEEARVSKWTLKDYEEQDVPYTEMTLHFTDGTKIQLPEDSKALHLIQQVRDEAHRFAITKHRAKRDKRRGGSVLEAIPGLGPKRRRDLLTHFGGIQGVLKASENDLKLVPGLGDVMARTIYKVLHE